MPGIVSTALRCYADCIQAGSSETWKGVMEMFSKNWHLGFTAFGGPPVHFQILHKKFVEKHKWIDEQLYQEIFALSQALPGPASTKMLFCFNCIHGGFIAGVCAFVIWCLPGAVGMYILSLGVSRISDTLPAPVYALLSGLNGATVGIIALAAVQLAQKAITDRLTRVLVFLGGVVGMLYTALWFFPVLMLAAGISTIIWDFRWLHRISKPFWRRLLASIRWNGERSATVRGPSDELSMDLSVAPSQIDDDVDLAVVEAPLDTTGTSNPLDESRSSDRTIPAGIQLKVLTWKMGMCVIISFFVSFVVVMTIRSLLNTPPRGASLFANLYLAGTIIFGGGPVVIPLLREYIVAEGWVSSRDFLLGLAIIQSFPGPNFNFAVYLGSLATARTSLPSFAGALIGFLGIYIPGLAIFTGVMGLWKVLRSRRWLLSFLRGVNAGAVGLVFTAVYKLWQIGYVDGVNQDGSPLGRDPWWVAITATSFVGCAWFGFNAPFAILLGGVMGMAWYAVVKP